jgi:hypothetical protein
MHPLKYVKNHGTCLLLGAAIGYWVVPMVLPKLPFNVPGTKK